MADPVAGQEMWAPTQAFRVPARGFPNLTFATQGTSLSCEVPQALATPPVQNTCTNSLMSKTLSLTPLRVWGFKI